MKLAYLGNHGVPYSTESHVAEALEEVGCEVVRIQEGTRARSVPSLLEGADLFLWTKTPHLSARSGPVREQALMLQAIKRKGVLTLAYHLDRYFDIKRESEIAKHPWWTSDIVFSADGGNQERFAALGVNHRWLAAGLRAKEVGLGTRSRNHRGEIVFVGSGAGYHAEWPWRQQLLAGLRHHYRRAFVQYPKAARAPVRGHHLNDLYASATVVVGDSILAGHCANYWSDRVYETVGRGGVLVHPHVAGLDAHFTAGEHYVAYEAGSLDSVYAAVDGLLHDADLRANLRANGPPHVAAHHTYTHRMRELLASVGASV